MNPITAFLVRNIIAVFFGYGLAFFTLGSALALTARRASRFRFVRAIPALAAFGITHGSHEWYEMFQKIAALNSGHVPGTAEEVVRLALLAVSFMALSAFGLLLLRPTEDDRRTVILPIAAMALLWLGGTAAAAAVLRTPFTESLVLADVLARYGLAIPGALLGAWALMVQQRTFREYGMPQFGRDLVWCAVALFLYGVVGQIFVRPSPLFLSRLLNSSNFLEWFGIPVQLFRAVMATTLTVFMVRALNAFELESQRQLDEANEARLAVQARALEAERHATREMERLNEELQLKTHELTLLLDLSNLLAAPMSLQDRLHNVLESIVQSLSFPEAGAILLISRQTGSLQERASIGFAAHMDGVENDRHQMALELGRRCVEQGEVVCRHQDGSIFNFGPRDVSGRAKCKFHPSPVLYIALPLTVQRQVIGSVVLGQHDWDQVWELSSDEFSIILSTAQQLGLSIENARLYQAAQEREKRLGELLHQVVGAQEMERQRIARELHDATGQSLTAVALGLRGVESTLATNPSMAVAQLQELKIYSTDALGELRHIISDLRPSQLDDLGLVPALQWYVQEFEKRYGVHAEFVLQGERRRLPQEYETVLFRIAQEALTNIGKHAHAARATVRFEFEPGQVRLTIEDDGRGFDPEAVLRQTRPAGWGLLGMQERALLLGGDFQIESDPTGGTCIQVTAPLLVEVENVQDSSAAG
jgi:signal transduction histidine kinase